MSSISRDLKNGVRRNKNHKRSPRTCIHFTCFQDIVLSDFFSSKLAERPSVNAWTTHRPCKDVVPNILQPASHCEFLLSTLFFAELTMVLRTFCLPLVALPQCLDCISLFPKYGCVLICDKICLYIRDLECRCSELWVPSYCCFLFPVLQVMWITETFMLIRKIWFQFYRKLWLFQLLYCLAPLRFKPRKVISFGTDFAPLRIATSALFGWTCY